MSISANAVWQKTGGSDSAGGGFDPSLTANMFADLTCTLGTGGSPVVASASYNFVSHDVGDWLFIGAGTNWFFGWFKIVSVSSGAATLGAAIGTAQSYAAVAGQFYLNTVAGVASVATQSANKATWAIDRSRRAGGAIFTSGTVGTSATSAFTPSTNTLTYTPGQQDVGNILQLISGTGSGFTASMYAITNATSTIYTLDRSTGATTATAISWSLGGSFATIGGFGLQFSVVGASGQRIYLAGSETLASPTANVATGTFGVFVNLISVMEGFGSVCGDLLPGAYISTGTVASINMIQVGYNWGLTNFVLDGNGQSSVVGVSGGPFSVANGLLFINFNGTNSTACMDGSILSSYFYKSTTATNSKNVGASVFDACATGVSSPGTVTGCIFVGSTVSGAIPNNFQFVLSSVAYKSVTSPGFNAGGPGVWYQNCVAYGNGTFGIDTAANNFVFSCAFGANSSGTFSTLPAMNQNQVSLTSDPYAGNHIGGGTDLVVNGTHNTWVTTATNTTVGGGGTAQSAQDIGLSLIVYAGSGWAPGIYKIVGYDSGTGSWILNASPAATSATGGSWRIADFRPNNVAGGGAALRAAGIGPIGQVSYPDIGAVQHQDSGGGGGGGGTFFGG